MKGAGRWKKRKRNWKKQKQRASNDSQGWEGGKEEAQRAAGVVAPGLALCSGLAVGCQPGVRTLSIADT